MSANNFEVALKQCLKWEGSTFTNDPDDRGGATKYGVIQTRYDEYRKFKGLAKQTVRNITMPEVREIYRKYYWDEVQGDRLPQVLDVAVFDAAVNHGPSRAAKWLQSMLGVMVDGKIGTETIVAAVKATDDEGKVEEKLLAGKFCDRREQFYEDIAVGNQRKWLKGWMNRLNDLRLLLGLKDGDGVG